MKKEPAVMTSLLGGNWRSAVMLKHPLGTVGFALLITTVKKRLSTCSKYYHPFRQQPLCRKNAATGKNIFAMDKRENKPFTIIIEGNIGSGKTTFINHFRQHSHVSILSEPIDKWRDACGHNLLDLMYKDPKRWSLCFQSYVQLTMLDLHLQSSSAPVKMMERSIYSAMYCFVENLKNTGLMSDPEYTVLNEWFDFIQRTVPIQVDLIVYLKTDPKVAFERIAKRGRSEENQISLEYLQTVHELHEDWLSRGKFNVSCPVLTIDGNTDLSQMAPNYSLCEERILKNLAVAT